MQNTHSSELFMMPKFTRLLDLLDITWIHDFTKLVLMLACSGKSLQLILNFCCSNTHVVKWFQFISGVCVQVYCK